jgi:hypothetical protein
MPLDHEAIACSFSSGKGFWMAGTARSISSGTEFNMMKAKFSFLTRVLEVMVTSLKQTL